MDEKVTIYTSRNQRRMGKMFWTLPGKPEACHRGQAGEKVEPSHVLPPHDYVLGQKGSWGQLSGSMTLTKGGYIH